MPKKLSEIKLLPCGHSIGVNLLKKDLIVMDLKAVMKPNGLYYYPANEWDIRVHDVLLEVEGHPLTSQADLCRLINDTMLRKETVEVAIRRYDQVLVKHIKPYYCRHTQGFMLGMRVKAFDVGLGTLTFYDPVSHRFGAFGHFFPNLPAANPVTTALFASTVSSIIKGNDQYTGKKMGYLNHYSDFDGTIEQNNEMGLFGTLNGQIQSPFFEEPLPVSLKEEILEERASILTVINDNQIEKFNIRITEVRHEETANKDLRILIEDEQLLLKAGGIVMGMSGSPIVQNGKIIGAVSYLLANKCFCGCGVSMENMLRENVWA